MPRAPKKKKPVRAKSRKAVSSHRKGGGAKRHAVFEEELASFEVAREICALRNEAGLSVRDLAKLAGISRSAICRLENADHEWHSLSMLQRVAAALHRRVEIRFVPVKR